MKNVIEVNGIRRYAYHGCLDEEGAIGGNYLVDVRLETDFMEAAAEDRLSKTVDYVHINRVVREEMDIRSKLIEHVGKRIYDRLRSEILAITALRVKITKISPPINGDVENVAIIIEE